MIRFDEFKRMAWSILAVSTVAFALGGCEGDDGNDGAAGVAGAPGADGISCWDTNANGVGDLPDEDVNGDGAVDVADCSAGADQVAAQIAMAQVESCGTCHDAIGDGHQAIYDQYADASTFTLAFDGLDVIAAGGGGFDLTLDFTITRNGQPYIDPVGSPPSVESTSFYIAEYDSGSGEFYNSAGGFAFGLNASNAASNGDGTYTLTQNVAVDPTAFAGGAIVGRIANERLDIEDRQAGKRIAMYADYAAASWPIGNVGNFTSAANLGACENCHGAPYRKHGNSPGMVAGVPDFTYCRGCHNNTASGGHEEWQHEMDDPVAWANGQLPTAAQDALYNYERTLQQDVHMSHALHLPYPQSMSSCVTCHGELNDAVGNPIPGTDKLAQVLDNSNFRMETCQGCHVLEGINASPAYGAVPEGDYYQPHRAPPFGYLWRRGADLTFHEGLDLYNTDCTSCHGNPAVGAPEFADYHNGYDKYIYDANGVRYASTYTATIDGVTYDDVNDTLTVDYTVSDAAVIPELLVSFYGWDTKDFLVPSHWRDASLNCSGGTRGCRFEFEPGDTNPLFTADAAVVAPSYSTTVNLGAFVAELTDDIPTLIDNMDVTKIEVTLTPYIDVGLDDEITLNAVTATYDLMSGGLIDNYFKGTAAIADYNKCNACHDQLAVTFHSGSGRAGEMTTCRNCHVVTNGGSHLEMQGRSLDSYVHGFHSFQGADLDDDFAAPFDAVLAKRYDNHIKHAFPYFTALACEACHNPGTYNVPDQSKSMPGLLSDSWTPDMDTWYQMVLPAHGNDDWMAAVEDPAGRNIGDFPEYVVGPASRSCGSCHRAEWLNEDDAGSLASFIAHTDAFGTLVENDTDDTQGTSLDDEFLFGIIDKIMTWFE